MKIWFGYGSEHSMNLILIGRFENVQTAEAAIDRIEALRELALTELPGPDWPTRDERMTDPYLQAMWAMEIHDMSRGDVVGFAFDYRIDRTGTVIEIRTDEREIQGFLKVLLNFDAKVEIFSLHRWNKDGTSRSDEIPGD